MKASNVRIAMRVLLVTGLIICIVLGIWGMQSGILTSEEKMEEFVSGAGIWGPLLLTVFQAVQVVLPILPGSIGYLAGVMMFGPLWGFVCNYIGICIGSFIVFGIAKNCGRPLLPVLFGQKLIDKYDSWTEENKRFERLFALAIFLPVAPDDFLCYLAGTTTMPWRKYIPIILLGKPFAIFLYSLLLNTAWTQVLGLLK